ncbi:cytochrome c-type biogenesis protein CcsB [Pedobacter sp. UYP24]
MFKTLTNILFSTRTMGTMLLIYAFSMAMATFVENDYGTPVAKALIYNCWWFELVMVILIINFIGNIKRYQLIQRKKWPLLLFHLAFVVIFIGGFITRYISFEGSMHIREGESSTNVVSDATFFKVQIGKGDQVLAYDDVRTILISNRIPSYLKAFKKTFTSEYEFQGERVKMKVIDFYARAQDSLVREQSGVRILHVVVLENGKRVNKYVPSGSVQLMNNMLLSFNKPTAGAINIEDTDGAYHISSPYAGNYMIMATQERKPLIGDNLPTSFNLRSLYTYGDLAFVIPEPAVNGHIMYYEGDKRTHQNDLDLVKVEITTPTAVDTVSFYGGKGLTNFQHQSEVGGLKITLAYGSTIYKTPFALKLAHFKMEKYPGSNSPAAYSSDVIIQDGNKETPYKIFMNHVLDHGGFRFFQSSFDEDEKGTILSVNHDELGTNVTYIGYTMLFLGLFITLFWKGTHFHKLNEQLKTLAKSKALLLLLILLPVGAAFSQEIDMHGKDGPQHIHQPGETHSDEPTPTPSAVQPYKPLKNADAPEFAAALKIDAQHADKFGHILVQNFDGRIEPVNTMALEILRKLHGTDHFYTLSANQFFLSISVNPFIWINVPIFKVNTKGGKDILKAVNATPDGYTSMVNLIRMHDDGSAEFVLKDDYMTAFAKKASDQNSYDKDLIELNDKLEAMGQLLSGKYLRVFPIIGDKNNTWEALSPINLDSAATPNSFDHYIDAVNMARSSGKWQTADTILQSISDAQQKYGKAIVPSATKVSLEISYNSWNLFLNLMICYAVLGTLILSLAFLKLFKTSKALNKLVGFVLVLITTAAFLQAVGLGVRWYISGHEPWSNGYEAVLFISWIGVVAGLLMYRNSNAFIPAAGCLVAVILMGFAHGGSQMNPQITMLVPVLKSYWLMIHVAIITSSYGFFGLSALIGTVVLLLFIIDNDKISAKVKSSVTELAIVNELSLTVGLFLLSVGTFLGGIWANESWGRYWSWDPKETWAFISVIIYAFILHVRLIPGLRSKYVFNLLSLVGFSTIIMTYFGVNYYLTGLHSYAQGDPVPIPFWVYITITFVFLLAVVSYWRYRARNNK